MRWRYRKLISIYFLLQTCKNYKCKSYFNIPKRNYPWKIRSFSEVSIETMYAAQAEPILLVTSHGWLFLYECTGSIFGLCSVIFPLVTKIVISIGLVNLLYSLSTSLACPRSFATRTISSEIRSWLNFSPLILTPTFSILSISLF